MAQIKAMNKFLIKFFLVVAYAVTLSFILIFEWKYESSKLTVLGKMASRLARASL